MNLEALYQAALAGPGTAFLAAERAVAEAGAAAVPFLAARAEEARGADALIARALLARAAGDEELLAALRYMDELEAEVAPSVMRYPSSSTLARHLGEHHGPALAAVLAGYVLRLGGVWPAWKTMGTLLFVGYAGGSEVADAVLAFALETPSSAYRNVAAGALVSTGDAAALARLEAALPDAGVAHDALAEAAGDLRRRLDAIA